MTNNNNKTIPDGMSAIPVLSPDEMEHWRHLAVTASLIPCRWMIDTGISAQGTCQCNLVECDFPQSPIYRGLNPEKPFRWKARLCNPHHCRFFEPDTPEKS